MIARNKVRGCGSPTDETIRRVWYEGQAATYCEMVKAGKPVASVQVPTTIVDAIQQLCENEGCLTYCADSVPGWHCLFIYQRPFLKEIIEHSLSMTDANAVQAFFRGAMYGYEMTAIERMAATCET